MKQLELFEIPIDYKREFELMKSQMEKSRKALFAQQAELKKMYYELSHDHEILKMNICKRKYDA